MSQDLLSQVPSWEYIEEAKEIRKVFQFKGYYKTIAFTNAIAWQAQIANHHPELIINFKTVEVRLTTHDADALTEKDTELAKIIDQLFF